MSRRPTPVIEAPVHDSTPILGHKACACRDDEGMWEGYIKHVHEGHEESLEEQYGRDVEAGLMHPSAIDPKQHPIIMTTTLGTKHATEALALRHAQIHVDCLDSVDNLLRESREVDAQQGR